MTSYTKDASAVIDGLRTLLRAEIKGIDIIYGSDFDSRFVSNHGEYARFWLLSDSEVSQISGGETREYEFELEYYIDEESKPEFEQQFDNKLSDRVENIKYMLMDNRDYSSSSYIWHGVVISDVEYFQGLEDVTEKIIGGRITFSVFRSNFLA